VADDGSSSSGSPGQVNTANRAGQSRDLSAAALLCRAATVRWGARYVQATGRRREDWSGDGFRQQTRGSLRAAEQRGALNGTTQAFWGCVSPRPTTLDCNDPPTAKQPTASSPNPHGATRHTLTPHDPRASPGGFSLGQVETGPGRLCHGASVTSDQRPATSDQRPDQRSERACQCHPD
jgi:hypothetical protein